MPERTSGTEPGPKRRRVFISYAQESAEHKQRVRGLADSLCRDGVDAQIDQYVGEGGPNEGWPRWMERQIEAADVVLMVCTPTYERRVRGEEPPGIGLGATYEAGLIRQCVYESGVENEKFRAVIFDAAHAMHIPTNVRGNNHYRLDKPDGYETLYRAITGQQRVERPDVGDPVLLTTDATPPLFPRPGTGRLSGGTGDARTSQRPIPPDSNLPPLSPTFVPRQKITQQIHAALSKPGTAGAVRPAAARALGGYGKTVAALLYAHEQAAFYTGGRFFLSMEHADFTTRLAGLGDFLGVPADAKPEQAALLVKQALESGGPALLILDNVTDAAQWKQIAASGLLPGGECRVLITTRAEHIPKTAEVQVGRLTREEAREVYRRFCEGVRPPPANDVADAITDWLAGLAVAVAAVAARMKLLKGVPWEQYADQLRRLRVDELPDVRDEVRAEMGLEHAPLEEHRRTLRVIDDALDSLPAAERRAVEYAALLPEDQVPAVWLEWLLERVAASDDGEQKIALAPAAADDPRTLAQRVLRHLDGLDVLVFKSGDERLLSLHRLWRGRVNEREAKPAERAALWGAIGACLMERRAVVIGADIDNPLAVRRRELRWELSPLAGTIAVLWQAGRAGDAAWHGAWVAMTLHQLGRLREAAACLAPVAEHEAVIAQAVGLARLVSSYTILAPIIRDLGDLKVARERMKRAIEIGESHFEPDHPTLAVSYSDFATILSKLGDVNGARAQVERAIEIELKHFRPDHPSLAIRYSNLAIYLQQLGDLKGARVQMERAITIWEKHFESDHPMLATSYSNLAVILKYLGELKRARERMEQAITINLKYFEPDHLKLAANYSNLALILWDLGDLKGARERIERAIAIDEKNYESDHPLLATRYNNLAHIDYAEGNKQAACAGWRRALAILLKHVDEDHPNVRAVRDAMKQARCGE